MCSENSTITETPCFEKLQKKVTEITSMGHYFIPRDMNMDGLPESIVDGFLDMYNLLKQWPELQMFFLFAIKKGIVTIHCTDNDEDENKPHTEAEMHFMMLHFYKRHQLSWIAERLKGPKAPWRIEEDERNRIAEEKRETLLKQQLSFEW